MSGFDMNGQVSMRQRTIRLYCVVIDLGSTELSHSCGIAGGEIVCWGLNYDGRGTAPTLPLVEDLDQSEASLKWQKVKLGRGSCLWTNRID